MILGLNEAASLAGVLTIHLLRFASSEEKQLAVISLLSSRPNLLPLLLLLYPTLQLRENFRRAVLHLLTAASPDTEAARSAAVFYGQILNKDLFPEQAGSGGRSSAEDMEAVDSSSAPLHHTSYGPWMAECVRCVALFLSRAAKVWIFFHGLRHSYVLRNALCIYFQYFSIT